MTPTFVFFVDLCQTVRPRSALQLAVATPDSRNKLLRAYAKRLRAACAGELQNDSVWLVEHDGRSTQQYLRGDCTSCCTESTTHGLRPRQGAQLAVRGAW